jgi:hypothetical protein
VEILVTPGNSKILYSLNLSQKFIFFLPWLFIVVGSCNDHANVPRQHDLSIPMIVRPSDSLLVGNYEVDEFSYKRIADTKLYPSTHVLLFVLPDNSFRITNLPGLVFDPFDGPLKGRMFNLRGSWEIEKDTTHSWGIEFTYIPDSSFKTGTKFIYPLKYCENKPAIQMYLGNPDSVKGLIFIKQ